MIDNGTSIEEVDNDFKGTSNYTYDAIGNLISDSGEQIEKIEWTLSGKVKRVSFTNNVKPTLEFVYDPMGNRVTKISKENANPTDWKYTYYSKDASGNTMAVYERKTKVKDSNALQIYAENNNTASIRPIEYPIYGSSRLGNYMPQADNNTEADYTLQANGTTLYSAITQNIHTNNDYLNSRNFELSDHLGNVSATVSDYKFNNTAQQLSAHVYYPYGMELPSTERCVSGGGYRYGFNGMEHEDDIDRDNSYTTHWRLYDAKIGRWLSVDPVENHWQSPYVSMDGNPILLNDPDGDLPPLKLIYRILTRPLLAIKTWSELRSENGVLDRFNEEMELFKTTDLDRNTLRVRNSIFDTGNIDEYLSKIGYNKLDAITVDNYEDIINAMEYVDDVFKFTKKMNAQPKHRFSGVSKRRFITEIKDSQKAKILIIYKSKKAYKEWKSNMMKLYKVYIKYQLRDLKLFYSEKDLNDNGDENIKKKPRKGTFDLFKPTNKDNKRINRKTKRNLRNKKDGSGRNVPVGH